MAVRQPLTIDEDERIRQHESVKDDVRRKVHSEIAGQAVATSDDRAREAVAAETLQRKAVDEITGTERELARGRTAARGSQVIDYLFYLVYGIIGVTIVLEAIGARESSGFKRFMDAIAWPFVAPFRGVMNDPAVGSFKLMLSYVVALGAYLLLHMAINGLLRIFATRKTAV
jgi:uncharacterized protein YggT (Ycf19 family)